MVTTDLYPDFAKQLDSLALSPGHQIVVALGGGADSQSVLDLTLRYREEHPEYTYLAIHLDHYFHPDSPKWAEFLRAYCQKSEISAVVEPLAVPSGARLSKEEQGRNARYQRMAELTEDNAVILLGQHRNDQTETFLLQLKRGAGPKGLAAMARESAFVGNRRLFRPLLSITKAEIYAYAHAHGVEWIEDDTNTDTTIERNFLRCEIIPILTARWPQFLDTVARSAQLCAEQTALLDELLQEHLQAQLESDGRLHLQGWWQLSEMRQRALLRAWLQHLSAPIPSFAVLNELTTQIQRSTGGKKVRVQWANIEVYRQQKWLVLKRER
ncbi:tRNA lysidine(34) synthetase TilS [Aliidiomarina iranensis]|uniref:tRNA(Ile)-lysidine synthase n=1 Tax=Aliidiomarina iranensis TaxID=1434071 RepID=A0A432W0U2_9GAMM|nr:tRNA lysidine(34) synthetase TilS [Aliidiomarina iranensis]RUO22635.1 tRNA lysidine(34) synthetase TilS [Aliidiomarina iranensis]